MPGLIRPRIPPERRAKRPALGFDFRRQALINAVRPWPYTPVSLPKREFMERSKQIWEELELETAAETAHALARNGLGSAWD